MSVMPNLMGMENPEMNDKLKENRRHAEYFRNTQVRITLEDKVNECDIKRLSGISTTAGTVA